MYQNICPVIDFNSLIEIDEDITKHRIVTVMWEMIRIILICPGGGGTNQGLMFSVSQVLGLMVTVCSLKTLKKINQPQPPSIRLDYYHTAKIQ